jgi:hypothetical protein
MTRLVCSLIALLGFASPALAGGKVCLLHGASTLVLTKPKLPKAGASSPLHGFLDVPGVPPLTGTLARNGAGTLVAGFTYVQSDATTCFGRVALDDDLSGTGSLRCTNDLGTPIALNWTPTDC